MKDTQNTQIHTKNRGKLCTTGEFRLSFRVQVEDNTVAVLL